MPINPRTPDEPTIISDPGKQIAEMAKEQATKLVQSVTSKSLVELTDMRDHLDTLMRAIKAREEYLIDHIENHAILATDIVNMKSIVRDSLEQLVERVSPTPKTVTARGNGNAD